jgi:hypothetical protein
MTLLRPRPLGDLHLHFLAIGIEKDEIILVDRHFDRIAHDQSFAGISGASPHALAARSVDDVIDLDRENRPAEARATVEPLIIGNIEELASLELMFSGARDTGAQYQRQNQPKLWQEALSSLLNAFNHSSGHNH